MAMINTISQYRTVYCLDMPGFGESEEPKQSWNVNDFIKFISEFIETQGIKELDLIGHSNGGRIIIKLMNCKNRFKVNHIILFGSAGIVHKKKISQIVKIRLFKLGKLFLKLKPIKKIFPNMLEKYKNRFGSADYRNATLVMKETMVKIINEDLTELLKNIKVPTLLIWGENDTQTPIEDAKLMEKLIPDAGLVSIKDCTHYVFLERWNYISKIINVFIEGE